MNTAKLHRTTYKNKLIGLISVLILTFCLIQDSECQTQAKAGEGVLDSIVACCHYLDVEITYIRLSFTFPDSAREFTIKASDESAETPRMKSYETYKFDFVELENQPLFADQSIINFTNCFYILDLVTKGNNNYLLLSDNFHVIDHQIKQFVKGKIFVDLFIEIDPFHIVDVMEAFEFHAARRDTIYMDTLVVERIIHDTVYVTVGDGDSLSIRRFPADSMFTEKAVPDTVFIEKVVHDTVFIDVGKDDRIFVTRDVLDEVPIIRNVVFANNGDYETDLNYVLYSKFSHWFEDPYFSLEFKFKTKSKDLIIRKPDKELQNVPEGWKMQFVITADEDRLIPFSDYVRLHKKIAIRMENNRCYILTRQGINLNPGEFKDKNEKTVTVRFTY
ncbi:MAG: hypothetical protein HQ568_01965 [Calditrichaeota bacterium]|nr:hypothetical protein [Calditrichota bacterium]